MRGRLSFLMGSWAIPAALCVAVVSWAVVLIAADDQAVAAGDVAAPPFEKLNALVEQARTHLGEAEKAKTATAKKAAREDARQSYRSAENLARDIAQSIRKELEKFPMVIPPDDAEGLAARDRLRTQYVETQLREAAIREELADAYEMPERKDVLEAAAEKFEVIYQKYRTRLAGVYARMYQGRCLAKAGRLDEALDAYGDLLFLPNAPAQLATLKAKAVSLAADAWCDPSRKEYERAIAQLEAMLEIAPPDEPPQSEWLNVRLRLARACKLRADELKASSPDASEVEALYRRARKLAKAVGKSDSEYRAPAHKLLKELKRAR